MGFPRCGSRRTAAAGAVVGAILAAVSVHTASATPAPAAAARVSSAGPVVLLLAPDLTWATAPPALDQFAKANLSMRTAEHDSDALDVFLTLGKGARSAHPGGHDGATPAAVVQPSGDGGLRLVEWPSLLRHDRSLDYAGTPGTVGTTLQGAGRRWGLVSPGGDGAPLAATAGGTVPLAFPGTTDGLRDALAAHLDAVFVVVPGVALEDFEPLLGGSCTIVVSASTPADNQRLGVLATSPGCGLGRGALASPSTHHAALATLPDVTATFLDLVGVPVPSGVAGRVVTAAPAVSRQALVERDHRAWVADQARTTFVWLFVLMHVIGAVTLFRWRRTRPLVGAVLLAIPPASLLMMLVPWWRAGWWVGVLVGAVLTAVIAAVGMVGMRRAGLVAIGSMLAVIAAVVAVDALFGSPLEIDAPFGNSPVTAGRFFGVGNIGSGFLVASLVVAGTLVLQRWGRRAVLLVAAAFAFGLVAGSAPQFGADVGGVLFAVPAYALVLLGLRSKRISPRDVALVAACALLAAVVFVVIDLSRHTGAQTHLGRTIGSGGLVAELERKGSTALGTVIAPMALIVVVAAAALLLTKYAPGPSHVVRFGAAAVLVAAVLGSALNDSGLNVAGAVASVAWPVGVMLEHEPARAAVPPRVPA